MKQSHKDGVVEGRMPRSRGAVSGLLLVILGAWGALIPFIGPHFNFAYTPHRDWAWSSARGWLEVLPGVATVVGGLLLIASRNRVTAMFGGWLAVVGGAWFVVGGQFAPWLRLGTLGDPIATTERKRAVLEVSYFTGVGVLIVFLAGIALARIAVLLARDVEPFTPIPTVESTPGMYRETPSPEPAEVSSEAITSPRAQQFPAPQSGSPFRRRPRRHGVGAGAGSPNAAYQRWPHPQQ